MTLMALLFATNAICPTIAGRPEPWRLAQVCRGVPPAAVPLFKAAAASIATTTAYGGRMVAVPYIGHAGDVAWMGNDDCEARPGTRGDYYIVEPAGTHPDDPLTITIARYDENGAAIGTAQDLANPLLKKSKNLGQPQYIFDSAAQMFVWKQLPVVIFAPHGCGQ